MTARSHIPFIPTSWAGTPEEFYRRVATAVNRILQGGPYPPQWRDNLSDFDTARVTGASQPTWTTFKDGISKWSFGNTTMNEVHVSYHINHDQAIAGEYRKLYPHVHWVGVGGTGTVRWGFEYTYAKGHGQEAFPATTTIYMEQAFSGTDYTHQLIESTTAIDLSSLEADGVMLARIFRDAAHANDTYDGTACFGLFCDLHYQASYFGTSQKTPDFFG